MKAEELEEKYDRELGILRELDPETSALSAVLVLRNILAVILGPVMQDPEIKGKFMELFAIDLKSAGYTLTKDEVPEEDSETTPEAA